MRVLVVDDSATQRRVITQMLQHFGFADVCQAEHGRQALEHLRRQDGIGLVVTDWNMPVMSGLELIQAIRGDASLSALPVLMVTTHNMKQDIVTALKAGVDNYIAKPFEPKTMQAKIRRLLQRS